MPRRCRTEDRIALSVSRTRGVAVEVSWEAAENGDVEGNEAGPDDSREGGGPPTTFVQLAQFVEITPVLEVEAAGDDTVKVDINPETAADPRLDVEDEGGVTSGGSDAEGSDTSVGVAATPAVGTDNSTMSGGPDANDSDAVTDVAAESAVATDSGTETEGKSAEDARDSMSRALGEPAEAEETLGGDDAVAGSERGGGGGESAMEIAVSGGDAIAGSERGVAEGESAVAIVVTVELDECGPTDAAVTSDDAARPIGTTTEAAGSPADPGGEATTDGEAPGDDAVVGDGGRADMSEAGPAVDGCGEIDSDSGNAEHRALTLPGE
ncbi:hypothetical protein BBJ28_00024343 [Nothophytophthora sp. Chile5]|nr:hypothetical protein BBJ28_00024343 [Nothophytophthora sp. Chile5]